MKIELPGAERAIVIYRARRVLRRAPVESNRREFAPLKFDRIEGSKIKFDSKRTPVEFTATSPKRDINGALISANDHALTQIGKLVDPERGRREQSNRSSMGVRLNIPVANNTK